MLIKKIEVDIQCTLIHDNHLNKIQLFVKHTVIATVTGWIFGCGFNCQCCHTGN